MHIEDITTGDAVTILRGNVTTICEIGCCRAEAYGNLKGLPIMVAGISLPYVVGSVVGHGRVVLDVRECELTKLSDGYLAAFLPCPGPAPVADLSQPPKHYPPELDGACEGK